MGGSGLIILDFFSSRTYDSWRTLVCVCKCVSVCGETVLLRKKNLVMAIKVVKDDEAVLAFPPFPR